MTSPMTNAEFWAIVDGAAKVAKGDNERFFEAVRNRLGEEAAERLIGFKLELERELDRAYRWDLWGAAYVTLGGCSDDMFEYFRAWMISRGKAVFEAALADPESLASVKLKDDPVDDCWCEELLCLPSQVYEELTDGEDLYDKLPDGTRKAEPEGEHWDDDDLPKLYPKLWKKYGNS